MENEVLRHIHILYLNSNVNKHEKRNHRSFIQQETFNYFLVFIIFNSTDTLNTVKSETRRHAYTSNTKWIKILFYYKFSIWLTFESVAAVFRLSFIQFIFFLSFFSFFGHENDGYACVMCIEKCTSNWWCFGPTYVNRWIK